MSADTRALFLLAMLMASSLGSIVPIVIKVALVLNELTRRAEEENITERIIDRTIDYVRDVAVILNEWFSINMTKIEEYNGTDIGINETIIDELSRIVNKTIPGITLDYGQEYRDGKLVNTIIDLLREIIYSNKTSDARTIYRKIIVPSPR